MSNGDSKDGRRLPKIKRIAQAVVREEKLTGEPSDPELIEKRYAAFMPDLKESLKALREAGADNWEEAAQEDVSRLNESFPGFDLLERIDLGGQGAVFKAVQQATDRVVAIKVLRDGVLSSPRQRERFAREIQLVSRLRHPHIVTLFESGVVDGRQFFAMEFVDGLPIDDFVLLHRPTVGDCVRLFVKVCRAVSSAHQRGIIHRDLKPSNILVDMDGEPKVLDFGLGKNLEEVAQPSISMTGQILGTLHYLSPEQAKGTPDDIDVRSDLYALAVILYELMIGVFPYPVNDSNETVRTNIIDREPASLRDGLKQVDPEIRSTTGPIGDDLDRVILKALSKEKNRRYESVGAFADDLERYLACDPVEAKRDSGFYVLKKTLRKYRLQAATAAALALVLAVSSVLVTLQWLRASAERDRARQVAVLAHSALDQMANDFEESVRPLAGGVEVRDDMMEKMDLMLRRLRPLVESDVSLGDVRASMLENEGDIAFLQGRHADAARSYRSFLEEFERSDGGQGAARIRAYRKLALVSDTAEAYFERAVGIGEGLVASPDAAYELCLARLDWGRNLYAAGEYAEAGEQFDRSIALTSKIDRADEKKWAKLLAEAQTMSGRAQVQLGNASMGLARLEEAGELLGAMRGAYPGDVEIQRAYLRTFGILGWVYWDNDEHEQAKAALEGAIEVCDYLSLADAKATRWKKNAYSAHDTLARIHLEAGALGPAEAHCKSADGFVRDLLDAEPANTEWQRLRGFSSMLLGRVAAQKPDWAEALVSFRDATEIREKLLHQEPGNISLKDDLTMALDWVGTCNRRQDRHKEAFDYFSRAYQIRQELLAAQPEVTKRSLDLVGSQLKFAVWHLSQHTTEHNAEASQLFAKAKSSLLELQAAGKLEAHERTYTNWLDAIRQNEAIIARRAATNAKPPPETDGP